MKLLFLATSIAAMGAAPAHGQETLRLDVTRASTPSEPAVAITIWAVFDSEDYAFCRAFFDLEAPAGMFFDTGCIPFPYLPCHDPGPIHRGSVVLDLSAGQFHFPPDYFADTSNPRAIFTTHWRPDDPATDEIEVITRTRIFAVFPDATGTFECSSRLGTFTEGFSTIRVRRCYTDCDGTDEIDLFDFLCFQDAFATGDHYADCDSNSELDFFDFLCFQNEFVAGCP